MTLKQLLKTPDISELSTERIQKAIKNNNITSWFTLISMSILGAVMVLTTQVPQLALTETVTRQTIIDLILCGANFMQVLFGVGVVFTGVLLTFAFDIKNYQLKTELRIRKILEAKQ